MGESDVLGKTFLKVLLAALLIADLSQGRPLLT